MLSPKDKKWTLATSLQLNKQRRPGPAAFLFCGVGAAGKEKNQCPTSGHQDIEIPWGSTWSTDSTQTLHSQDYCLERSDAITYNKRDYTGPQDFAYNSASLSCSGTKYIWLLVFTLPREMGCHNTNSNLTFTGQDHAMFCWRPFW